MQGLYLSFILIYTGSAQNCINNADDPLGARYRGTVSQTKDGKFGVRKCLRWNVICSVFIKYNL